ncbi:MAG TPA: hypothetical protein GXX29_13335 [Firmicutes bacterium]|nr:hypothetical protein [Bacillota bacterium]
MKAKLFGMLLLVVLGAITAAGCHDHLFDGTRLAEADRFHLIFKHFCGVQKHTMMLNAGDVIDVNIKKIAGRLDITILDSRQKVLYQGRNADWSHFKVVVMESEVYSFVVVGKEAKGSVLFTVD